MKFKRTVFLTLMMLLTFAVGIVAAACGSGVTLSFETNGGHALPSVTVEKGESVTLPTPENKMQDGNVYIFDGWSAQSDLGGPNYSGMIPAPEKDMTFYAKWARGYRISLDPGEGSLSTAYVYVKEKTKILDALKGIVPTGEGLDFGAWYLGDGRVTEDTLMPDSDVTLTAKYQVGYTVSYFLQSDGGEYTEAVDRKVTGKGIIGEKISAPLLSIEGYVFNGSYLASKTEITLTSSAELNALRCYYDLVSYRIVYDANAPEGSTVTGETESGVFRYGEDARAAACGFSIEGYRFAGWAESEDGKVVYHTGDPLPNESAILYAVWDEGIPDALGGGDYLFLPESEAGVVYLVRGGIEKRGSYDAQTKIFVFSEHDKEILSGKITGGYFYYFIESYLGTFSSYGGGQEKLEIRARYEATFTDGRGATEGVVEFDPERGYYVFRAEDRLLRFVFVSTEEGLKFFMQNMDEEGYYATAEGYPVIYLDGLGNFTYYFDPEHPTYYDISGEPLLEASGEYDVNSDGYYSAVSYVGDYRLEEFLFRITDEAPAPVAGFELKQKAIERSSFYGDLAADHSLVLNGFGGGTYTDEAGVAHKGVYEIVHNWWMTLDGRNAEQAWLIAFDYEGAQEFVYYALTQDREGRVTAQLFGKVEKGKVGGLYLFDNAVVIGGESYPSAFLMILLDTSDSMVLVEIDKQALASGEEVGIYAPMYTGTVEKMGERYQFRDSYDANARIYFELSEDKAHFVTEGGDLDEIEIDEGLTVDPNTSTATYIENGKTYEDVPYSYSHSEYLEFYTFRLSETRSLFYYREEGQEKFTRTTGEYIFDYAYLSEDLANAYPALLLLIKDSERAYLAIPMAIGDAYFVGDGTYRKIEDTNEYTYENRHWVDGMLDFFGGEGFDSQLELFQEYYQNFRFRTEGGSEGAIGEFYQRNEDMYFDFENFEATGYDDRAVYTKPDGTKLSGTFYRMEIIIVFTTENGDVYYLKEGKSSMQEVSDDAGLYYYYDADDVFFETFGPDSGYNGYSDYLVYDGENGVTIVEFSEGVLPNFKTGTIERTENWKNDFREYRIVETETGETFTILLGTFKTLWGDEYLIYDRYSEAYKGEWTTEDGGTIRGDGYRTHDATYDEDGDGNADYTGLMVRASFDKKDINSHAYTVDPQGDVIVFTYSVDENDISFVFNIVTGGGGLQYLVKRNLIFGAFAYWTAGERPGEYLYLDGTGKAELYDAQDNLIGQGTYELAPDVDEVSYFYRDNTNANANFHFAIYIEQESGGMSYFEYRRRNPDVQGEYDADDWAHLSVGYYGEIVYTDRYGVVYEGYYRVEGNRITLVTYDGSGITFTFNFDKDSGYFGLVKA